MSWKLISEHTTPSDEDTIMASFNADVSDQKFSPTGDFLKVAYGIFNHRFFNGTLPSKLEFRIKTQPTKSYIGMASYVYDNLRGRVKACAVTLNGSRTLTLHEWLEVVLHEMIHVLDYETNPERFVGYMRRSYDAHGSWFLDQGKKFESEGFHVQRYCNAEIGVNTSNTKMKNRVGNSVFLYMQGTNSQPLVIKTSRNNLDRNLEYITARIGKGSSFGYGVKEIKIMSSENPNVALLKDLRMRNEYSRISWWWFTDNFQQKYGPFEVEDTVKILSAKNPVTEDDNEPQEEQSAEEAIEQICDNIDDVEEVKEIGNDKIVVSIP